jgi:hypothetical protein
MGDREFREFAGRFGAALGDALNPQLQAQAVLEHVQECRYHSSDAIAVRVLEKATEPSTLFDEGHEDAFQALRSAHEHLASVLEAAAFQSAGDRPGGVAQDNSRVHVGLQAADVAAALARAWFEEAYSDTETAARSLLSHFEAVLLNTRWL